VRYEGPETVAAFLAEPVVVGALLVVTLNNYLAGFGSWVTVITGAIFVVCVLAFRRGIVGEILAFADRSRSEPENPRSGPDGCDAPRRAEPRGSARGAGRD